MANVIVPNYARIATAFAMDVGNVVWKLTRAMKAAGYHTIASSDGVTKNTSSLDTEDLWGLNANPLNDDNCTAVTQSLYVSAAWVLMQGPSTLKLYVAPATLASTFIQGENIIQTTTNAEGEFIGLTTTADNTVGYMVIRPRIDGSGGGNHGWDTTNDITGSTSGASVTPTGASVGEFVREFVFWKAAKDVTYGCHKGTMYYQCVNKDTEGPQRFSALTGSAGCTATVAPGGGGAGNAFPTSGTMCIRGTGGSTGHSTWCGPTSVTTPFIGFSQIIVANAISGALASSDGSFFCLFGAPFINAGAYMGFAFQAMDNSEEGDVEPYVLYFQDTGFVATSNTYETSIPDVVANDRWALYNICTNFTPGFKTWYRRGWGTADDSFLYINMISMPTIYVYTGVYLINDNTLTNNFVTEYAACSLERKIVRDPLWAISTQAAKKCRKGSFRWMSAVSAGNGNDTYDNRTWLQVSNANPSYGMPFVVGPWDGVSIPVNG